MNKRKLQNNFLNRAYIFKFFILVIAAYYNMSAQESKVPDEYRDSLVVIAREYIQSARYCTLITIDSSGYPHARVMDPFKPEQDMVIWLGTNRKSRKVTEIRANSRVTLFYFDNQGTGYVSITGDAYIIDDQEKKTEYWKPEWERFYKDKENYILIKIIPQKMEVLNYQHGIYGDPDTWETPSVDFGVIDN